MYRKKALSGLKIRQILASSSSGKELALDLSQKTTISSDYRDISVLLSYPCYDQPAIRFKFKLYANNQLLVEDSSFPSVHFGSLLYESIQITDCGPVSGHSAQTQAKLQIMMQYIHDNYSGQITLDDIAGTVLICKSSVLNIFRTYLHTSPINYVVEYRLKRASKLLVDGEPTLSKLSSFGKP
jgi:AraC-like DNA-binding protein